MADFKQVEFVNPPRSRRKSRKGKGDSDTLTDWIETKISTMEYDSKKDLWDEINDVIDPDQVGAQVLINNKGYRKMIEEKMFTKSISAKFDKIEAHPRAPDADKWRARKTNMIGRSQRADRFGTGLSAFGEAITRGDALKGLSETTDRSIRTLEGEIKAFRAAGFLDRQPDGLWVLTDAGKRAREGWG